MEPMKTGNWRRDPELLDFRHSVPLSTPERWGVAGIGGVGFVVACGYLFDPTAELVTSLVDVAITALFVVFLWSPQFALTGWAVVALFSFSVGHSSSTILALGIAAGLYTRVGSLRLIALYVALFLIGIATTAALFRGDERPNFIVVPLIALVSGGIGVVLRIANDRERRLSSLLAKRARAEQEVIRAERLRIADELHDVIAHDLTVIAMHARVLDRATDDESRQVSQEAIGTAARKALADLRRVVDPVADAEPPASLTDLLAVAFDTAEQELVAGGHTVAIEGDPLDTRIPRLVGNALARILRESVTNILKHGVPGLCRLTLTVRGASVTLQVHSAAEPVGQTRITDIPSGGYGTMRMSERSQRLGGTFESAATDEGWLVTATLPLA